ncbi:MAG: autotransporter outer membrane beta-barrel domain-containing protein [Alphaproteobacteria bacterium]
MRNFLRTTLLRGSCRKGDHRWIRGLLAVLVVTFSVTREATADCEWTLLNAVADCDGSPGGDVAAANFSLSAAQDAIDNTLRLINDTNSNSVSFDAPIDASTQDVFGDSLILSGDNLSSIDVIQLTDTLGFETLRKEGNSTWGVTLSDASILSIIIEAGQVDFGSAGSPSTFSAATALSVSSGGEIDGYLAIGDPGTLGTTVTIETGGELEAEVSLGGGNNVLSNHGKVSSSAFEFGPGDDVVLNHSAWDAVVDMGSGEDTLTNHGTLSSAGVTPEWNLGDGDDRFHNYGLVEALVEIDLGPGADTAIIYDGELRGVLTLDSAGEDDSFTLMPGGAVSGEVATGAGNDQALIAGDLSGSIDMGPGVDHLTWDTATSVMSGYLLGGEDGGDPDANIEIDVLTLSGLGATLTNLNLPGGAVDQWEEIILQSGDWILDNDGIADDDLLTLELQGGSLTIPAGDRLDPDTVMLTDGDLIVDGALNVANPLEMNGGALMGEGVITGDVVSTNGTVSPADIGQVGELTIDGDLTLGQDVVLTLDIDPESGATDLLTVTGQLDLQNPTLSFEGPSGGAGAQDFTLIEAGSILGDIDLEDTATLDYEVSIDTAAGEVTISINPTYETAGGEGTGNTENQNDTRRGVADAVNAGLVDEALLDALDDVAEEDYLAILDQLHGEAYVLKTASAIMANNLFSHQLLHRLGDRERCGTLVGAAETNCRPNGERQSDLWVDVVLERLNYEHPDASMAADVDIEQIFVGFDTHSAESTFGVAGAFAQSEARTDLIAFSEGQVFNLGFYGSRDVGLVNLDAALIYGYSHETMSRTIDIQGTLAGQDRFVETIKGSSARQTLLLDTALTQEFRGPDGFELQPKVGLTLSHSLAGEVTETAADGSAACAACLTVSYDPFTRLSTNAGLEARLAMPLTPWLQLMPEIRGALEYTVLGREATQTNAFVGGEDLAWDIEGYVPDNVWALGFGLNVHLGQSLIGFLDFDRTQLETGFDDRTSFGVRHVF